MVGPIDEALIETFFLALFGGEEINTDFLKYLAMVLSVAA